MVAPRTKVSPSDLASCGDCPLTTKECRIVPAYADPDARAVVILDFPREHNLATQRHLTGKYGKQFRSHLRRLGIEKYSLCYRVCCPPHSGQTKPRVMEPATKACHKRFMHDVMTLSKDRKLPILCCGKWASSWLGRKKVPLRSGHIATLKHSALAKEIPYDNVVCLDSPVFALYTKPAMQIPFLAGLKRFSSLVHGEVLQGPPQPMIRPSEEMLAAIQSMGPEIGWDVETLGANPMEDALTAVGFSDGIKTISVPWDDYYTKTEGDIKGIANSTDPLHRKIHDAILNVLASRRLQVLQNGNYDVAAMGARGLPGRNDWDIMHAHGILWPEILHNLEAIAVQTVSELHLRWKSAFRAGRSDDSKASDMYISANQIDLRDYHGYDCWTTIRAKQALELELAVGD